MECDKYRDTIEAYLDAELPEEQERETFRHISECRACGAQALTLVHTKRLVKSAGMRYKASDEFRRKVLGGSREREKRPWRLTWMVAATAVIILAIATGFLIYRPAQRAGEFADLHVAMLASANPLDVVSTDKHTVKPWFQGRIPFAFDLPDLSDVRFSLAGARLVYIEGRPAAELIYMYDKHKISVFVTEKAYASAGLRTMRGFRVLTWEKGGLGYTLVTDAGPEAAQGLAAVFQQ